MPFMSYVVYDETGELIGGFLQDNIPAPHVGWLIFVDERTRMNWPLYRANAARDGVELIEASAPEDPPVDPEPEDPVQSDN